MYALDRYKFSANYVDITDYKLASYIPNPAVLRSVKLAQVDDL